MVKTGICLNNFKKEGGFCRPLKNITAVSKSEVQSIKMKTFSSVIKNVSKIFDEVAGWILAGVMLLIVVNVILRAGWSSPVKGTYEYVGYFTAIAISLSIAYCAVKNGHIAVTIIAERFPGIFQKALSFLLRSISIVFFVYLALQLANHAAGLAARGEVSPTTRIAYYPYIYIAAFGVFVLALVIAYEIIESFKKEGEN